MVKALATFSIVAIAILAVLYFVPLHATQQGAEPESAQATNAQPSSFSSSQPEVRRRQQATPQPSRPLQSGQPRADAKSSGLTAKEKQVMERLAAIANAERGYQRYLGRYGSVTELVYAGMLDIIFTEPVDGFQYTVIIQNDRTQYFLKADPTSLAFNSPFYWDSKTGTVCREERSGNCRPVWFISK